MDGKESLSKHYFKTKLRLPQKQILNTRANFTFNTVMFQTFPLRSGKRKGYLLSLFFNTVLKGLVKIKENAHKRHTIGKISTNIFR